MKTRVLVVEDDPNILLGLEELLKGEGFEVSICKEGRHAIPLIKKVAPDLVLLDVMLPGQSGFEICRQLRAEKCTIPILMLTAKSQEMDKVIGLELGADDYVTKPFGVRELLARIHALLRRNGRVTESTEASEFKIGSCVIDGKRFQLRRGKEGLELTSREVKLLRFFHERPEEVLTRNTLLNAVWGYNYFGTTRTLDQTIVQLRKKLGEPSDHPRHLLTVHGVGYKLIR